MGFRCTWVAVRGATRDPVLAQLRLAVERSANEPVEDTGLYGLALPTGWYLAIGDGSDYMGHLDETDAVGLSRSCEALFFYTDDTPMATRLACYRDGSLAWAINYEGVNGVAEPQIEGAAPPCTTEILAGLQKEQVDADGRREGVDFIYELTADVAKALVGFRHDQTLAGGEVVPVDILNPVE